MKGWVMRPFETLADLLVERIGPDRENNKALNEKLLLLSSGRREAVREYYLRKYSRTLLLLLLLAALCLAAAIALERQNRQVSKGRLERPADQQKVSHQELIVAAEGEQETDKVEVTLKGRLLTAGQAQMCLDRAQRELEEGMAGANPSLDEVRDRLWLPDRLENGAVQLSYVMIPYGMIGDEGTITGKPQEEGSLVEIQAQLKCQDLEQTFISTVRVLPQQLSEKQRFWKTVKDEVDRAQEASARERYLPLPAQVEGRRLYWTYPPKPWLKLALFALLTFPALWWILCDSRVNEKAKARKEQLSLDYGELMWKMTMLTGAGLTLRGTFSKIAQEYTQRSGKRRYAYEEVVRTCREMRSGVPEDLAYERFGKRCGLLAYIRLGSLLSQNLKKGAKGLTQILEKEAAASLEERRSEARKLGERAGIKLLLPMVLMLGVVMAILIIPAFAAL